MVYLGLLHDGLLGRKELDGVDLEWMIRMTLLWCRLLARRMLTDILFPPFFVFGTLLLVFRWWVLWKLDDVGSVCWFDLKLMRYRKLKSTRSLGTKSTPRGGVSSSVETQRYVRSSYTQFLHHQILIKLYSLCYAIRRSSASQLARTSRFSCNAKTLVRSPGLRSTDVCTRRVLLRRLPRRGLAALWSTSVVLLVLALMLSASSGTWLLRSVLSADRLLLLRSSRRSRLRRRRRTSQRWVVHPYVFYRPVSLLEGEGAVSCCFVWRCMLTVFDCHRFAPMYLLDQKYRSSKWREARVVVKKK